MDPIRHRGRLEATAGCGARVRARLDTGHCGCAPGCVDERALVGRHGERRHGGWCSEHRDACGDNDGADEACQLAISLSHGLPRL